MLAAAASAVGAAARGRLIEGDIARGSRLARSMLAEVLSQRFADPFTPSTFGPESGESQATRSTLNDMDDYDALSESPPTAPDRTLIPDAAGWSRTVKVETVTSGGILGIFATDTGVRRITIKAISPRGKTTTLVAYAAREGSVFPSSMPPGGVLAVSNITARSDNGPAVTVSADMLNTPGAP